MTANLSPDMKRLLVLIDDFSEPAHTREDVETWIKKIPLQSLISKGVREGVFRDYDIAPQLVNYMGTTRFAGISKEGEDDVADLREMGLVERLKLATSHHVYVSAYRITPAGKDFVKDMDKAHRDAAKGMVACNKCGGDSDIEAREDAPYLVCSKCGTDEKVDIFDIEEVAYVSGPYFMKMWLPPD